MLSSLYWVADAHTVFSNEKYVLWPNGGLLCVSLAVLEEHRKQSLCSPTWYEKQQGVYTSKCKWVSFIHNMCHVTFLCAYNFLLNVSF